MQKGHQHAAHFQELTFTYDHSNSKHIPLHSGDQSMQKSFWVIGWIHLFSSKQEMRQW